MKNTGMRRSLDFYGRIVIPKEMRVSMGFNLGDSVEYFFDNETGVVTLQKSNDVSCKICGSIEELTYFNKSFLCKECIVELKGDL
ncbi:bifunctional DNA-binding transcriptional regulator/antitoxin component of YhaV-PrlF toxin-antitoxin module [Paenibacillus brasilensis]|uniref:Bifunctional DNA-binding transcriptional regulator/antitoxin component of YhaV-PrlF toxin-antitoxin module n=1 Tax=Paenibacillus brasilensis TaxID=128574 RepID=A0ABU0L6D4_9BACL|nr:AbrB/MazE/SpoVT family DNA-binding domain-containing protein [Paenibacillus brasilensis]MDQ0496859.1 bifunctional DNA-binding transcriptional regulator/antitoxin component of YhaV-PrlF toxin-antitoxin module [Paenibacillus brasilensis]